MDFRISRGPPTVHLISRNAVFFKFQNSRKAGTLCNEENGKKIDFLAYTVVRKFAISVSFGILVVFLASELQTNARVWYSQREIFN